jgi:hypothetical protein
VNGIQPAPHQRAVIEAPSSSRIFLSGPAGTGKTTTGVERLRVLLEAGVPGHSVLMLTPQRTIQDPYLGWLNSPERPAGSDTAPVTISGLSRRMVDLFWPLAAEAAGFAHPEKPPIFLSLETSQYYMAHIVRPLLDAGFFESVTIDRNRLYSQILDNLNKAAVVGFPHTEIGVRLASASFGDPAQRRVYADAQDCAIRFRDYCLRHNLLDFSLMLEVFANVLWPNPPVRSYLTRSFHHLIYDNVEEDNPRAHDIIREWLPSFESALLIFDEGGGYRQFLGADAVTGRSLGELCDQEVVFNESFVMSPGIAQLRESLLEAIQPEVSDNGTRPASATPEDGLEVITSRFYPELLDSIADEVQSLVANAGMPASEIVIVAPYLSDALRFSVTNRLEARGVRWRSHRPSRSLRDEPASHALLTLAAIAHPDWNVRPPKFDVAYALVQSIDGLDLVRAQLLTEIVYRMRDFSLSSFDRIQADVQERITYALGERYSRLRDWLLGYRENEPLPLDHFLRRLFGEVLSQPGFGFHRKLDAVRVAASLTDSVKNFRLAVEPSPDEFGVVGQEYIALLSDGVIAASYLEGWRSDDLNAVLVAPAYTFIMMNRPVAAQFWMDVSSSGWHQRPSQPVTHPYVLSRGWEPGRIWSDADEVAASDAAMARVVAGLLARCRERVYLGLSELGESGFEQRGELLRAFQKVLQGEQSR